MKSAVFLILLLTFAFCGLDKSACKYTTDDKEYDLSELSKSDLQKEDSNMMYYVRFCQPTPVCSTASPADASVCQSTTDGPKNAGSSSDMEILGETDNGLTIKFGQGTVGCDGVTRATTINLVCSSGASTIVSIQEQKCIYAMTINSPAGCAHEISGGGLSAGSIILIIVACLVFVYLVGGMAFNYKFKELRGVEMVPNVEFWKDSYLFVNMFIASLNV